MKPLQIVYVLAAEGRSKHVSACKVSAALARAAEPDADIILLCDRRSRDALHTQGADVEAHFARIVSPEIDEANPVVRSRWLKTGMRDFVDGDFVYLDTDALPLGPIRQIASSGRQIKAVVDKFFERRVEGPVGKDRELFCELGWPIPDGYYCNSGVLYMPDNDELRALAGDWRRRWLRLLQEKGIHRDQPALNAAIAARGAAFEELPDCYNAMVSSYPGFARGAVIQHFYLGRGGDFSQTLLDHLVQYAEQHGSIDWAAVERCRKSGTAWVSPEGACNEWTRHAWRFMKEGRFGRSTLSSLRALKCRPLHRQAWISLGKGAAGALTRGRLIANTQERE